MLGALPPFLIAAPPERAGPAIAGEMDLPPYLLEELRLLGLPLASYTRGELESARIACAVDGKLIDDPDGFNFLDKLQMTYAEREARRRKTEPLDEEITISAAA